MGGRFDKLTQLANPLEQRSPPQKPESPQVGKQTNQQTHKPASGQTDKPANPQTRLSASPQIILPTNPLARKTATPLNSQTDGEKPEKYTTRLKPSMTRKVKVFAAQQDINDYDV